ncbi:hypothetical protein GmHk_16G046382 [Glycine max]|nr:hypothetical protein GmHk_16G046382 [Glycine max]
MINNEKKTLGVVVMIMIMLDLAQAGYNPSFVQVESNNDSNGVSCRINCTFDCAPQEPYPFIYSKCISLLENMFFASVIYDFQYRLLTDVENTDVESIIKSMLT